MAQNRVASVIVVSGSGKEFLCQCRVVATQSAHIQCPSVIKRKALPRL